jgi:nitroimidazol reductase NimA-like FMN-containing flavoprotein (pyridoxamine 5'-phosphate oxidase superfamily)
MISILNEEECFELLAVATVGRLGFVRDGRVQVIPVNYLMNGRDIVVRTLQDGILSVLPGAESDAAAEVAFEVDHIDGVGGYGWSVLTNGSLEVMPEAEAAELSGLERVRPWPDAARSLTLRFDVRDISGRHVRRNRERR